MLLESLLKVHLDNSLLSTDDYEMERRGIPTYTPHPGQRLLEQVTAACEELASLECEWNSPCSTFTIGWKVSLQNFSTASVDENVYTEK